MTPDEQFALAKQELLGKINTWEDLYAFMDDRMAGVHATLHPALVFEALFTMYAFMQAMRDLPEEGDIKVIAERMIHIMVYDSKERLGVSLTIMRRDDGSTAGNIATKDEEYSFPISNRTLH